jgi:hypothetical protein
VAAADINRFHIVLFRAESQASICWALANALAVMASLVRMAAAVAAAVAGLVLAEEFI